MSPLAELLKRHRYARALRQEELAELVGCERSYVSALENDLNLTPPSKLVERLAEVLSLNQEEKEEWLAAVQRSRRRYIVSADLPPAAFELAYELLGQLDCLTTSQIEAVRAVLKLGPGAPSSNRSPHRRVMRRDKRTEAAM
jgi:transcriptional regulator with XRE-family HTH domain